MDSDGGSAISLVGGRPLAEHAVRSDAEVEIIGDPSAPLQERSRGCEVSPNVAGHLSAMAARKEGKSESRSRVETRRRGQRRGSR